MAHSPSLLDRALYRGPRVVAAVRRDAGRGEGVEDAELAAEAECGLEVAVLVEEVLRAGAVLLHSCAQNLRSSLVGDTSVG
jgi:hypothetical protein